MEQKKRKTLEVGGTSDEKNKKKQKVSSPDWQSSTPESPLEILVLPKQLNARNFPSDVTEYEVLKFFNNRPYRVILLHDPVTNTALCSVFFRTHSQTKEALKFSGKKYGERVIYVTRAGNDRQILRITGFKKTLAENELKARLTSFFSEVVRVGVLNVYLPDYESDTLGLCYMYINNPTNIDVFATATIGDDEIDFEPCLMKPRFKHEIEGSNVLIEDSKTTLKKKVLPSRSAPIVKETKDYYISFRVSSPDIISPPILQTGNDCWAIGLSRAYNATLDLKKPHGQRLNYKDLIKGVDASHLASGGGIDNIKNAIPFMEKYVEKMLIYHRPRGDNWEHFEAFEEFIIQLLKEVFVMVTIEYLPSYAQFNGNGIYSPSDVNMRYYEIFPTHCLVLTGYGMENGKEFWELHDSEGIGRGDQGFIRIERHKALIKSVVEFKV